MFKQNNLCLAIAVAGICMGQAHAQETENTDAQTAGQENGQASAAENNEDPVDLEEIIVQGVRNATMNARLMERNKDIFSSVITQDDAGNFTDQNVAEALQRLPGVTIQKDDGQGEFVNLRGLGPNFVGVSLNNAELASSGADGRAVALNGIPADLMGSIEIFKSLTPDMDLNSIAGRVNVNSVTAFDRGDEIRFSLQGFEHDQRGELTPKFTFQTTQLFLDDTLGVTLNLIHEDRETEVNRISNTDSENLRFIRVSRPGMGSVDTRADAMSAEQFREAGMADPFINEPFMLTPRRVEVEQDESERETQAITFNTEWRPSDDHKVYVRFDRTEFTDKQLTMTEQFRFDQADERFIAFLAPADNIFAVSDADFQQQTFIEDAEDTTTTIAIGGENTFKDLWTLEWEFQNSEAEQDNPSDRRVQFRIRELPLLGGFNKKDVAARVLDRSQIRQLAEMSGTEIPSSGVPGTGGFTSFPGFQLGERRQPAMAFDNLFLEDGSRNDEIDQYRIDLRRDFEDKFINYVKVGFLRKERTRDRDRARWSVNPSDFPFACEGDETCLEFANTGIGRGGFETFTPRNPRIEFDFITVPEAEELIEITRPIPLNLDPNRNSALGRSDDFEIFEDSNEAYIMGQFQITDRATLIAGGRYVETDAGSTGFLTLRNDRFLEEDGVTRDISIPLTDPDSGGFVENSYDGFFPSVNLKYEPTDKLLVRAAVWTSFTRPNFDEFSADADFDDRVVLCTDNPLPNRPGCSDNLQDDLGAPNTDFVGFISENFELGSGNQLDLGNTDLVAMEAINLDASISWFGEDGHFAEAAFFYKELDNFIVDVRGVSVQRQNMPAAVRAALDQIDSNIGDGPIDITQNVFRIDENFVFDDVNTTINGETAEVWGVELSYTKFFESNFFVQANATIQRSRADLGETVRFDTVALPNQADETFNLVVGWENDFFSARLLGNFTSETLEQVGTCSSSDLAEDARFAQLNDASNPDAFPGAVGDGQVIPLACRRFEDVFKDDAIFWDAKITYNPWPNVKLFFDVLNIDEEVDRYFIRGNGFSGGNTLYESEGLGRTFQAGVNVRF